MTPERRARNLIEFADGLDEGGFPQFAAKARMVARDVLELVEQIDAERSARIAMTVDRDRWRDDRWRVARGEAWPA